jgi:galactose mutarotase-like enzyme
VSNEAGFRYRLTKQVVLRPGARLEFYYEVLNEAQSSVLPFYVAWHPLFALQCPAAVSWNPSYSLVLTQPWFDHRNQQLWPIGSRFSYRTLQQLHGLSYDPMQPTDPPDTLKGFIEGPPHATGLHLTYSLPHTNRRLRLTFTPPPESRMPMQSVGLWFNRGGFRNEANVALEPCTFWGDTPNAQPGSSLTLPLVYPMHTGYTRFICQLTVL